MKEVANWAGLPSDLTCLILAKLVDVRDLIRFGVVCQSWLSSVLEHVKILPRQLPILLFPTQQINQLNFYSHAEKKFSNFPVQISCDKFFHGSTNGWLVTRGPKVSEVCLFNPFSFVNNVIHLPPLSSYDTSFSLWKLVLSGNPTPNRNYVAVSIMDPPRVLHFCRPGDKRWTTLFYTENGIQDVIGDVMDVIYYKDLFYAVDHFGKVYVCDLNQSSPDGLFRCFAPKLSLILPPSGQNRFAPRSHLLGSPWKRYLVESSGDLLQVIWTEPIRFVNPDPMVGFEVFKLTPTEDDWVKVMNVDGNALFLGCNFSISLSVSDFPACKPDSIYYTGDYYETSYSPKKAEKRRDNICEVYNTGIFNLEDGGIEDLCPMELEPKCLPPIKIEPSLPRCLWRLRFFEEACDYADEL